jgi:hypothetical protein
MAASEKAHIRYATLHTSHFFVVRHQTIM